MAKQEGSNGPSQHTRLDTIGYDIQYLIAAELFKFSPSAVLALSHSARSLRQAALPFVYRDIVLTQGWSGEAYNTVLEIMRTDESCEFVKHVRNITIKDDIPEEDLLFVLNEVAECAALKKLSWNTSAHIPDSVYSLLHTFWPSLELSMCVLNRKDAILDAHRRPDTKLLSSPLLKDLTCNVFYEGYESREPNRCEWPKLMYAITTGGNLRVLKIQVEHVNNMDQRGPLLHPSEPKSLVRPSIPPGRPLPTLEELRISEKWSWGSSTDVWDLDYCRMLRAAMDWSRLRKLDFGNDSPDQFFVAFTGVLPELKSFRFGTRGHAVGPAVDFMNSIVALEALDIVEATSQIDALWPAVYKHKDSLQTLILRPITTSDYAAVRNVEMSRLRTVAKEFLALERLGWAVPYEKRIDPKWLLELSKLNLRKLDLFLHLPNEPNDFSAQLHQDAMGTIAPPPIDKVKSKKAAIEIMQTISKKRKQRKWLPLSLADIKSVDSRRRGPQRPLEWLTLHFTRTGYMDRAQPYVMWGNMQVRRDMNCRVGGNGNINEAYEVRGKQDWGEQDINLQDDILYEEDV